MLRRLTAVVATAGWIYSWFVIRGIRREYAVGDLGVQPVWLTVLMGLVSTALLALAVSAAFKLPVWPAISPPAGMGLAALVILGQLAVMRSASPIMTPGLADAWRAYTSIRGPVELGLFLAGVPIFLLVAGPAAVVKQKRGAGG